MFPKPSESPSTLPVGVEVRREVVECLPVGVLSLLLSGWVEIVKAGLAENAGLLLRPGQYVLWLEKEGTPVAAVAYDVIQERRMAWVSLGCVAPTHRRQGFYRLLSEQLARTCKAAGLRSIRGGVHRDNHIMRQVADRLGREEVSVQYVQKL